MKNYKTIKVEADTFEALQNLRVELTTKRHKVQTITSTIQALLDAQPIGAEAF